MNLPGGNPRGRSKYYLNDAATIKKLKAAAKLPDITITPCQNSVQIKFNAGAYVEVGLRLLKYWETCEGETQIPKDVDGLDVKVIKVETFEDAKGLNERHIVRLLVEGEQVTVTLWDTTCGMGVQAASQLAPYTSRVLFPYLHEQIRLKFNKIRETNEKVKTLGETKVMTRTKRQELVERAAILESPARTTPLSVTDLDSPAPVRLLNRIITWVSTPSRQEQEKELMQEVEDLEEQEEEEQHIVQQQEQELGAPDPPLGSVHPDSFPHLSPAGVLALSHSPPKEQQSTTLAVSQEVACFPCDNCETVFTTQSDLSDHMCEHRRTVPQSTNEIRPLTASGRLLVLTPNFGKKHQQFLEARNNVHDNGNDDSSEDEDESNDCQDTCKVCQKTFSNTSDLQDHILGKHNSQSERVLEQLKLQEELLNSLLAGQAAQLQRVNAIALTQTCLIDDIKELKKNSSSSSSSLTPSQPSQAPVEEVLPAVRAPAPSYLRVAAGRQQERSQQQSAPVPPAPQARRNKKKNKLLMAGDSLLAHHHRELIKEATKSEVQEVQEVKCYAAVYSDDPAIKFRRKNFSDVVPAELEDNEYTAVLLQSSSVELTNLKGKSAAPDLLRQTALVAARNMFDVATVAATYPTIEKVILAHAPPRIDEMREHAEYGNSELDKLWQEAEPALKDKISIGRHEYLRTKCPCRDSTCQLFPGPQGGLEAARYGTQETHGSSYDGVHFRGSSGKISNTRSLIDILTSVGLASPLPRTSELEAGLSSQGQVQGQGRGQRHYQGQNGQQGLGQFQPWQQQGRRNGGRTKGKRREQPFQLALRNRFQGN